MKFTVYCQFEKFKKPNKIQTFGSSKTFYMYTSIRMPLKTLQFVNFPSKINKHKQTFVALVFCSVLFKQCQKGTLLISQKNILILFHCNLHKRFILYGNSRVFPGYCIEFLRFLHTCQVIFAWRVKKVFWAGALKIYF